MITNQKREEYRIRAWYYKPIIDNQGNTPLDWNKNDPQPFWCKTINKTRKGLELIQNGIATSNDRIIETDSTIDFEDKGKIVFAYRNPEFKKAERIKKEGITILYDDMETGNRITRELKTRKRIILG